MHSVFIVGCGDIGRRIARRLPGLKVTGLVSGQSGAALLKRLGIMPVIANLDIPGELDDLDIEGQVVFYLAPPPGGGEKDTRMRHFLEAIRDQRPEKLVYISPAQRGCKAAFKGQQIVVLCIHPVYSFLSQSKHAVS
ncbi:MAG: hypothetical protein P8101_01430 [Candidatus Thiodiazotropha sp.]